MPEVALNPDKERQYAEWKARVTGATPVPDFTAQAKDIFASGEKKIADIEQARSAEASPIEAGIASTAQGIATEAEKQPDLLPMPKNMAQHLDPKQMNEAASAWMTLGALAGLLTRQPMTAALGNMTAAMQGVIDGDAAQYDTAIKEFNNNFDKAMKVNRQILDEKKDILENKKLSLSAKEIELRLVNDKYGNQTAIIQGSIKNQIEMLKFQEKATERAIAEKDKIQARMEMMQRHRETLAQAERHFQILHGQITTGTPKGPVTAEPPSSVRNVNAYKELLFGDKAFTGSMGNKSAEQRQQAREDAAVLGASLGLSPLEQAMLPTNNAMKVKAADALTKWGAFIDKSAENIKRDVDLVVEAARKVDPGSLVAVNRAVLAGEQQFQDGNAQAYALAVNKLKTEYIRLQVGPLSNAMLPVDAAHRAESLLSNGISAENWDGPIRQMIEKEAQNTKASATSARDALLADISSTGKGGAASPQAAPSAAGWSIRPK